MIVATNTLSQAEPRPKQTKLLGAHVRGLGLVVAVSSTLFACYALVEGSDRVNRRVLLADLKRDEVVFPAEAQPYVTRTERVSYNCWDEVHSLIPAPVAVAQPVVLAVAA